MKEILPSKRRIAHVAAKPEGLYVHKVEAKYARLFQPLICRLRGLTVGTGLVGRKEVRSS